MDSYKMPVIQKERKNSCASAKYKQFQWYYHCKWPFEVATSMKTLNMQRIWAFTHCNEFHVELKIGAIFIRRKTVISRFKGAYCVFIPWLLYDVLESAFSHWQSLPACSPYVEQRQQTDNLTINGVELASEKKLRFHDTTTATEYYGFYKTFVKCIRKHTDRRYGSVGLFATLCCEFDPFGVEKAKRNTW